MFGVVGRACRHLIVRHSKVKKIVFKKQPIKSIKISLLQKRFTEVPFRPFRAICKPQKTKKQKNKTTSIRRHRTRGREVALLPPTSLTISDVICSICYIFYPYTNRKIIEEDN